jgi:hypothetical protein
MIAPRAKSPPERALIFCWRGWKVAGLDGGGVHMRRLLSAIYIWAMRFIAPALGLDCWDISTSGGEYNFRRYNVSNGKWQSCGLPPDGCVDIQEWLKRQ